MDINIPPKSSPYGYNSEKWFNHLSCLVARYESNNCCCLIGDFNSRIGCESDLIDTSDEKLVNERLCVDTVINEQRFKDSFLPRKHIIYTIDIGHTWSHVCTHNIHTYAIIHTHTRTHTYIHTHIHT